MRYFKNFRALVFPLAVFLLSACSVANKGELVTAAEASKEPVPEQSDVLKIELVELEGSEGKVSWDEYKSGIQALEAEDYMTAMYYFDLSLGEVYAEQEVDSLASPKDSAYFAAMPNLILSALESLYPKLVSIEAEHSFSMLNDYEIIDFSDDEDDETPLDSVEKEAIEHSLDAMDLSKFSLPIVVNERVVQEVRYLSVKVRSFTEGALSRKTALDSMIYEKLRERKMPEDLIYLAFVESGFKLHAYSRAKAAGVWQFIPGTGKRYGVPVDFWIDMRRNPEAATDAALSYLSDLYDEFGDWHLAMAAYNCGEGRIRRLVKEARAAASDSSLKVSYWDLKLPRETMHYVPRILAATIIGHSPENYSFVVEKQSRLPFDTVTIKDCIPLDKAGGAVGVSVNTMRDLNPELTRWCTPPNLKSFNMRIPHGSREKFLAAYEKMDKTQLVRWQQYKVQKGDNLGYISKLFGLKVSDIQAANNLTNSRLRVGQTLIIPMPAGATPPSGLKRSEKTSGKKAEAEKNDKGTRSYTVKSGDNLVAISRRFGVSSQNLRAWNSLDNNKLIIGQRLLLQDPSKKAEKSETHAKKAEGGAYIVKSGDNLWEIARSHGVTVQQLREWNPGVERKIIPGMRIKVAE